MVFGHLDGGSDGQNAVGAKSGKRKGGKKLELSETIRDVYGFTIRPQYVKHYKMFAPYYAVEEEERSLRWEAFLNGCGIPTADDLKFSQETQTVTPSSHHGSSSPAASSPSHTTPTAPEAASPASTGPSPGSLSRSGGSQNWAALRSSLWPVQKVLQGRGEDKNRLRKSESDPQSDTSASLARTKSIPIVKDGAVSNLRRTQSGIPGKQEKIKGELVSSLLRQEAVGAAPSADGSTPLKALSNDDASGAGDRIPSLNEERMGPSRPRDPSRIFSGIPKPKPSASSSSNLSAERDKETPPAGGAQNGVLDVGTGGSTSVDPSTDSTSSAVSGPGGQQVGDRGSSIAGPKNSGLRRAVSGFPVGVLSDTAGESTLKSALRRTASGVPGEAGGAAILAEVFDEGGEAVEAEAHDAGAEGEQKEGGGVEWGEELHSLVVGGVPMALRAELWQVFVGTKSRRVEGLYDKLHDDEGSGGNFEDIYARIKVKDVWTVQIEKDLQRTFPGNPMLEATGRDALRRVLSAYAKRNPELGYCQGMNFLAGLLLLMMPEENAFWTLTGIMEDYLEGYYSDDMVEAQVDQLCFEEVVRDNFPRLVSHLDMLGVQVGWVSGPWFLSVFVNVLPWECLLRVWDVLLYEGNRSMLFRTGLALMEMHSAELVSTFDPGDCMSLLQSMAGSTFDSSQLVLTACIGYADVDDALLEGLRAKHRPAVLSMLEERRKSIARYHNEKASQLVAEAKLAQSDSNGASSATTDPPADAPTDVQSLLLPPEPAPEGAPRREVLLALKSHRQSLMRHQSMKGDVLAAAAVAAIAEKPPPIVHINTASHANLGVVPFPAGPGIARANSGMNLMRHQSMPKFAFQQALAGSSSKFVPSLSTLPPVSEKPSLLGRAGSGLGGMKMGGGLMRHQSAAPSLLQAAAADAIRSNSKSFGARGSGLSTTDPADSTSAAANGEKRGSKNAVAAVLHSQRAALARHLSMQSEELGAAVTEALADIATEKDTKGLGALKSLAEKPPLPKLGSFGSGLGAGNSGSSLSASRPAMMEIGALIEEDETGSISTRDDVSSRDMGGKGAGNHSPGYTTDDTPESDYGSDADDKTENLQAEVAWLKEQMRNAIEAQDAANRRSEELQVALVQLAERLELSEEVEKTSLASQVNDLTEEIEGLKAEAERLRRELSASQQREKTSLADAIRRKEKQLEDDVDDLLTALAEKEEKLRKECEDLQLMLQDKDTELENLVQVMMRMQHEQKITEDLRLSSDRQVATQRQVIDLLVEKNKEATNRQAELEKRALMAESMLQAFMAAAPAEASYSTFEGGQRSHHSSPRRSWSPQPTSPGGGGDAAQKKSPINDRSERMNTTPGTTRSPWAAFKDEMLGGSSRGSPQLSAQQQHHQGEEGGSARDGGLFHSGVSLDDAQYHPPPKLSQGGGGGGGGSSHPMSRRTSFNSFSASR